MNNNNNKLQIDRKIVHIKCEQKSECYYALSFFFVDVEWEKMNEN